MGLNPLLALKRSFMDNEETSVEAEVVDSPAVDESVDTESAPSADSGENHEKESNGIQKRFNELTAKRYEAESSAKREREEKERIQRELDELKAQQDAPKPVEAPSEDLMYENPEEYKRRVEAHAEYKFNQGAIEREEARRQQEQQEIEQQRQRKVAAAMDKRFQESAANDGVELDEALKAAKLISSIGIAADISGAILNHDNQAAIVKYLGDNLSEMDALNKASGNVFATVDAVKSLAEKAVTKKVSSSPDPIPNMGQSSGISEPDEFGGLFSNAKIT